MKMDVERSVLVLEGGIQIKNNNTYVLEMVRKLRILGQHCDYHVVN